MDRAEDFVEVVRRETEGRGADVIFDPVGGETFDRSRRCVAWEGRLLVVGFASGTIADAPTNHALLRNYAVMGLHWAAYRERSPQLLRAVHDDLLELYARRAIRPLLYAPEREPAVPEALALLERGETYGRVVVHPPRGEA